MIFMVVLWAGFHCMISLYIITSLYVPEWSMDCGGYISYVAKGEDEEVGSDIVSLVWN